MTLEKTILSPSCGILVYSVHSKHLGGKAIRVFDEIHGTHTRGE